jgi:phage-related protein
MARTGEASILAVADVSRFAAQLRRDLNAAVAGIRIDADSLGRQISDSISDGVDQANVELLRLGQQADSTFEQSGRSSDRLSRRMQTIGSALKFAGRYLAKFTVGTLLIGGIGAAAGAATGQLLGLVGVLAQTSGAIVAVPAAIGVAVAAIGTLKIATSGFGDALKAAASGDLEKFDKAVEGLSPVAKTLAAELRAVIPAMTGLKNASQDAFSAQLVGQISATAAVLTGPLKVGLTGVAAEWGNVVKGVAGFVRESATVSAITSVLTATKSVISGVGVGLQPILAGFRDMSVVALPVIVAIANVAGSLGTKFGAWLSQMASSGQATAAMETAFGVLSNLATLVTALGQIFMTVFQSASQSSGGLLGSLLTLVVAVNTFLQSAAGQTALTSLFTTLSTLSSGLAPVFSTLINIVAGLIPVFGQVAVAVIPALQAIADGLAPAITALQPAIGTVVAALSTGLQAIAPALLPLGQAIGAMLTAIAPLLPVLGQLIGLIVGQLAGAIAAIVPALGPLINALGPVLIQVMTSLMSAIGPVIGLLVQMFVQLGPPLGQIVVTLGSVLAPVLVQLAPMFMSLVNGLMPLLPAIVALVGPLLQIVVALTPMIVMMVQLAAVIVTLLGPTIQLTALWLKFLAINVLAPVLRGIASALEFLMAPLGSVLGWLTKLSGWLATVNWGAAISAIKGGIGAAFQWLSSAAQTVWNALVTAFNAIGAAATWLWSTVLSPVFNAIKTAIGAVVAVGMWFWSTFGPIWLAIGSLIWAVWSGVFSVVFGLIKMAISGVVQVFQWWWQIFSATWTAIGSLIMSVYTGFIQPIINAIGAVFTWLWVNAISPALSAIGAAVAWVWSGISAAFSAIGGVLSWLGDFFSRVWDAIVSFVVGAVLRIIATGIQIYAWVSGVGSAFQAAKDAIVEKINSVVEFVKGLPGKILAAVGNLGSLLYNAGQNVINGLISGLNDRIGALRAKISEAAGAIRDALPFSPAREGPLSGKGDPTIAGGKIVSMVATGMVGQIDELRAAAYRLASATSLSPAGGGAGVLTGAGVGQLSTGLATATAAAPQAPQRVYQITVQALDPRLGADPVIAAIKTFERTNGTGWRTP